MTIIIPGVPMAKPRMTRRDTWKLRPCVLAYRDFCDRARMAANWPAKRRLAGIWAIEVLVYLPMPRSWSERKRSQYAGTPHTQRPDGDNLLKAVCDALFVNDECLYRQTVVKYWDDGCGPRACVVVEQL